MRISIFILPFLISGCTGLASSVDDLHANSYKPLEYKSERSPVETYEYLKDKMTNCYEYHGSLTTAVPVSGIFITNSVKSGTFVEGRMLSNDSYEISLSQEVGAQPRGYMEVVDIRKSKSYTSVTVYPLNRFWVRHAERIETWLAGGEITDCKLW
ncbi:hypothetical protein [Gallaecimonas sp. GXIMD1310]|uniref:hypothetical protein n=1 Tax=Gallaecimonas sp. GXIMD1310 TaxID=3131926 RepID=UPI0032547864